MQPRCIAAASLLVGGVCAVPASAIEIEINLSHDTFFSGNTTARNALQAAATDISNAITTVLNSTSDVSAGTFQSTTVTYDFSLEYTNPTTGGAASLGNAAIIGNRVPVFVGHRNLTGTTLAQGGPGSVGFLANAVGFANELQGAVNAADANATANLRRGDGPTMATFSGTLDFGQGANNPNFSFSYGSLLGNLWFDSDSDNNGVQDAGILNSSFWHFDHTTAPAAGKIDLYSVALHELLHAIGIGTSQSWFANASGNNWLGPEVIDLLGSGAGVITGGHIAENLMSRRITDLASQEVVMSPTIGFGERRFLTELDLAFLRDINWDTVVVPEPGAIVALALPLALLARRRRTA